MSTRPAVLAVILGAVVGLTACGSSDGSVDGSPSRESTDGPGAADLTGVEWQEAADGTPLLVFDRPLEASETSARIVESGYGAAIESGQIVVLDYVVFSGSDGAVQYSTYVNGFPDNVPFVEGQIDPSLWDVLDGAQVGVRFLFAGPDTSIVPTEGVYPGFVAAMTVVKAVTVLDQATGEAVAPGTGLPSVTVTESGMPDIDFTGAAMPTDLVVQPLILGAGDPVVEGQTLIAHYTGWLWDGEAFDSSWAGGVPATFGFAQGYLIDGWIEGLRGQTVGSRVLLVVPPDLGYGEAGQGSIPGGATLVFVVDILAAI